MSKNIISIKTVNKEVDRYCRDDIKNDFLDFENKHGFDVLSQTEALVFMTTNGNTLDTDLFQKLIKSYSDIPQFAELVNLCLMHLYVKFSNNYIELSSGKYVDGEEHFLQIKALLTIGKFSFSFLKYVPLNLQKNYEIQKVDEIYTAIHKYIFETSKDEFDNFEQTKGYDVKEKAQFLLMILVKGNVKNRQLFDDLLNGCYDIPEFANLINSCLDYLSTNYKDNIFELENGKQFKTPNYFVRIKTLLKRKQYDFSLLEYLN